MRPGLPSRLFFSLWLAIQAAALPAVESDTPVSRQLDLYYTLQQRIAQPGEISDEGLAGLKLLLAQLYSEMGMLQAARQTLDALQGGPSIQQLRDMGRLLLARQYRMRGEMEAARAQLEAIGSGLDRVLDDERQQMLALAALERGAEEEAMRRFALVQSGEGAVLLARFNYAAMLLRGGQQEHGLVLLQELAAYPARAEAVDALRDRANLLLGYYFLRRQHHEDAGRFLQKVGLNGPYYREAMLAQGWVELALRGPEYAMVPWMELLAAGLQDSLAEEAELAMAAALAAKGPSRRVIDNYSQMIGQFEQGHEQVREEMLLHAQPYAPQQIATLLQGEGEQQARQSVAGEALERLLTLRQALLQDGAGSGEGGLDEGQFFEQLWPRLHTLYPQPDEWSGIGVAAHVARRTESIIRNFLRASSRSPRPALDLQERLQADHATLEGEIEVVAEWYRRSRLAGLQARERRLQAYMERARLAIARNHDLALRRQERE